MDHQKIVYIVFAVTAVVVIAVGVTFGLKGALYVDKDLAARKELSDSAFLKEDVKKINNTNNEGGIEKSKSEVVKCDVVVVGGGAGGIAAAISSAREGANTCLVEETDWLGGMLTSAGVSAIDGREDTPSGIFREIIDRIEDFYSSDSEQIHNCNVSWLCFEPSVGNMVIKGMVADEKNLRIFYNSKVNKVYRDSNKIKGVSFTEKGGKEYIVEAKVTVDATEFGDLMYLADIPYDLGSDKNSQESLAESAEQCIQPLTYVAILKKQSEPEISTPPPNYNLDDFKCVVKNPLCPDSESLFGMERLLAYGRMPNGKLMINIPSHSWGNDFHATTPNLENYSRADIMEEAKNYSRGLIYFMQTELGMDHYALYDEFGTEDKFAKIPYVRESRRLRGVDRLTEFDIVKESVGERADLLDDVIAIGDYPIDLHFCQYGIGDVYQPVVPYQIPYGVTVSSEIDGFMVADKNISVSHIANGTTRLQPVTMAVGQAVGIAAAMASENDIEPRSIDVAELQKKLLQTKSNLFFFKDLPSSHFAYPYVARLAIKGYISGYGDLTFRPNNLINQADLLKIFKVYLVSEGWNDTLVENIGVSENSTIAVKRADMANYLYNLFNNANRVDLSMMEVLNFKDVKKGTALYDKLSQLARVNVVDSSGSYFRPNDILTRAEAMVLIGRALDNF